MPALIPTRMKAAYANTIGGRRVLEVTGGKLTRILRSAANQMRSTCVCQGEPRGGAPSEGRRRGLCVLRPRKRAGAVALGLAADGRSPRRRRSRADRTRKDDAEM